MTTQNQYDYTKILLWPSPFFIFEWVDYRDYKDNIIKYCYELKESNSRSDVAPDCKDRIYESSFDFLDTNRTSIIKLKEFFNEKLWMVLQDLNGQLMEENSKVQWQYESWCHITNDNGYHDVHVHPMCSWSGIFYVEVGEAAEKNGVNRWFNPVNSMYNDYGSLYQTSMYTLTEPKNGQLVIFPSHLLHNATPYQGNNDRIVVGFNVNVYKDCD